MTREFRRLKRVEYFRDSLGIHAATRVGDFQVGVEAFRYWLIETSTQYFIVVG